jgi:signal transduction histidine kinase
VGRIESENIAGLASGQDFLLEYRIRRKQGDYIIIHNTVRAIKDSHGNIVRLIGGVRDVTKRKNDEQALLRSNERLEQKTAEVEKYASRMEALAAERARQLQEAERLAAIGATAGMVGHDIRNPLQAIMSDVFLLKDYLGSMPERDTKLNVKESLEGIEKNILYINKIVADLQDYSRKLKPEYRIVNLTEVIIETLKALDIPANVTVNNNAGQVKLRTDGQFIRRILTNLFSNSIQAMPNGGNLTIEATEKQRIVDLTVADTGVGIPEEVKPKLFTPMMTTKSKGQGLGLAVVKRLIGALGGTVSFESNVGKGTKFIIKLPSVENNL